MSYHLLMSKRSAWWLVKDGWDVTPDMEKARVCSPDLKECRHQGSGRQADSKQDSATDVSANEGNVITAASQVSRNQHRSDNSYTPKEKIKYITKGKNISHPSCFL